jgi:hypothetical protein
MPKRVLDIGIGYGKWGVLLREYTDIWNGNYFDHKVQIDGIEVYLRYITLLQKEIYDNIHYGSVVDVLPNLAHYNIVMWGDCIEHLTKEDGHRVLSTLKKDHGVSFVTTPRKFMPQGKVYGNPHETHVSVWGAKELGEYGVVTDINGTLLLEINIG